MVYGSSREEGEVVVKIREARRLAHYWLDILGIPEWKEKLVVRWGAKKEMPDVDGLNFIEPEFVESEILLWPRRSDEEIEHTIVHELLHLVVDGHKVPDTKYDPMHERALNRLATTLIALDRLGNRI